VVEVFENGGARAMSETWMELLERMGVFSERQVEKCRWCKKDDGTVQIWGMNQYGEKYPVYKICTSCHRNWLDYTPKRRARKGGGR
jgi:hypothetical protein